MSSPELKDTQLASSSPFQSAQQQADQYYVETEDLDLGSGSDYLSNAPPNHSDGKSDPLSSQRESSLFDGLAAERVSAEDDMNEDSQDSTTLPSRPNKFRGPSATWRNRTAPARELAVSLDTLQAKDLSIHLYNAFKLGQRKRIRVAGRHTQTSQSLAEANEGSKWIPPKNWTAWPLPPAIVPREHDETRWEEGTVLRGLCHSSPRRPSQHLREMLIAQVLRNAKDRFRDRRWGSVPPAATGTTSQVQETQGLRRVSKGRLSATRDDEVPDQKPVVMADDQRASKILQPTVQHMIAKLDDLLMGLHHARSAYLLVEDSGSESQSQTSERSRSRGRPTKRKRRASKSNADAEASHDAPNHPGDDSDDYELSKKKSGSQPKAQKTRSSLRRPRSQTFHDRKSRLGLRDWGDVVGIASMTGWWHQNVVRSATTRCATLFEEGIKFRTLEEGKKVQKGELYLPNAPSLTSGGHNQSEPWRAKDGRSHMFDGAMVGGVHVDGFLKPIEGKKSWIYSNNKQSKRRYSLRRSKEEG